MVRPDLAPVEAPSSLQVEAAEPSYVDLNRSAPRARRAPGGSATGVGELEVALAAGPAGASAVLELGANLPRSWSSGSNASPNHALAWPRRLSDPWHDQCTGWVSAAGGEVSGRCPLEDVYAGRIARQHRERRRRENQEACEMSDAAAPGAEHADWYRSSAVAKRSVAQRLAFPTLAGPLSSPKKSHGQIAPSSFAPAPGAT